MGRLRFFGSCHAALTIFLATMLPAQSQTTSSSAATFVTSYKIIGAEALPSGTLEPALREHVMQEKTLLELRQLAAQLERQLQTSQGLVSAKVWIPLLEDNLGEIAIRVMPGVVHAVRFAKPLATAKEREALALLTEKLKPGSLLLHATLESTALALTNLLGTIPNITLIPAPVMGQYDVVVSLRDIDKYSLSVGIDNLGNRYTNIWREKTQLQIYNSLREGDLFSVSGQLTTPNQKALQLRYETPLGSSNYKLGLTQLTSRYQLGDAYASLEAKGDTHVTGIDLSYSFIRSTALNVTARGDVQSKRMRNLQADAPITDRQIHATSIGLFADAPSLGGVSTVHITMASGNVDMTKVAADVAADTASIGGAYQKMTLRLGQSIALGPHQRLQLNLNAQRARKNLDLTEALLIGGMSGVRAYPLGEAAADSGATVNLEIHQRWNEQWRSLVFYDQGWATLRQLPVASSTSSINKYDLNGIGFSVVWMPAVKTEIAVMPTWKLKANPAVNATTGADADGRNSKMRIWFFATQLF